MVAMKEKKERFDPYHAAFEYRWRKHRAMKQTPDAGNFDIQKRLFRSDGVALVNEMEGLHDKLKALEEVSFEDLAGLTEEMCNAVFSIYDMALAFGWPLDKLLEEVQRARLSEGEDTPKLVSILKEHLSY